MSTSLLYHAFSIRGYEYGRTEYQGGEVIFTIRQEPKTFRCEACGSRDVRPRGHVKRRFQSLSIGSRTTAIVLPIPRVACQACGVIRQVKLGFADPRRTYTKAFERYVLDLSRCMTILDVARHLNVSWDIARPINPRKRLAQRAFRHDPATRWAASH
jgi:transposase